MTERELYLEELAKFLSEQLDRAKELLEDVVNDPGSPVRAEADDFLMDVDNQRRLFDMRNGFRLNRR